MSSCNTYCLTWFLFPWVWGISSQLLQQSAAIAPYLGRGVSPHHCPSWPSKWDSSSRPSCARAAAAPWTWGWSSGPPPLASGLGVWGISSRPPPLTSDAGYLLSAVSAPSQSGTLGRCPDLRHGVTPLGRHPSGMGLGLGLWQPTPVFLPGESHGQRSLVGYSPWGHRELHDWVTKHNTAQHRKQSLSRYLTQKRFSPIPQIRHLYKFWSSSKV